MIPGIQVVLGKFFSHLTRPFPTQSIGKPDQHRKEIATHADQVDLGRQ
jgi:hypothetical protein